MAIATHRYESMTNQELMEYWASNSTYTYFTSGNLSLRHSELFSYKLKIATRIGEQRETALILPVDASKVTTNNHIRLANMTAQSSTSIAHVFNVPELDPASVANLDYYAEHITLYAEAILNKRRKYKNRVIAAELYIETLATLRDYFIVAAMATGHPKLRTPELLTVRTSVFDIIEEANDLKFLGQLALEGDSRHLHHLEEGL